MTLRSSVAVRGKDPLYFTDYLYSADGLSLAAVQTARGLRVLVPLLFNPYEPVRLERIQLEATLTYKADYAEIVGLRLPDLELPAGEETWVDVDMRPYNGRVRTVRVPLLIPKRLAGALVKLEVVPGDQANGPAPPGTREGARLRAQDLPGKCRSPRTPPRGRAMIRPGDQRSPTGALNNAAAGGGHPASRLPFHLRQTCRSAVATASRSCKRSPTSSSKEILRKTGTMRAGVLAFGSGEAVSTRTWTTATQELARARASAR